mgnify:FL=1
MNPILYPIGIQSFEQLRRYGYRYVDKTAYVYRLTREPKCFFLSRPRRFGKSLLLSTMEAYFLGKRELFEGLAISQWEKDWIEYPVLHFDFSRAEANDIAKLGSFILDTLKGYADQYGVKLRNETAGLGVMFGSLIEDIHATTGKQVVILVDEYDKSTLEVIENEKQLKENQDLLQPFFTQIKALGAIIRFAFITGVARFRHYTIFSGFNNLDDISLDDDYAAICGLTEQELTENFAEGIKEFSEQMHCAEQDAIQQLRFKYDGYRFTAADTLVYNPFSILNALSKRRLQNFWVQSGASKPFIKFLTNTRFDIMSLLDAWLTAESLEATYSYEQPLPLLFQTGYLTIERVDGALYKLNIPNGEVRSALVDELIPKFMGINQDSLPKKLVSIKHMLESGDVDGFMRELQSMIASIPYHEFDYGNVEKTYHLIVYQVFLMLGIDARSEIAVSGGRIDMVAQTAGYVYVFEFKLGNSPTEALSQIEDKGYSLPWSGDGRKVVKIGVQFSPDTRTISAWQAVEQ